MSLVFWDTNLFIYLVEEHPRFGPQVEAIRARMLARHDHLCTSALTVGEALVGPTVNEDQQMIREYQSILGPPLVRIIPFEAECGAVYARIRTDRTISRTDAMQLACAARAGVDLFVTNDRRLGSKVVPGIQFIAGIENCPL
jgi:predicted nucleic acid-binding protein